jgi:single-stranded DNA-specific DHH superfamily exonuclease
MLSEKQIQEIREYLQKSQNPLFFFDNDNDGLCAFLLLRRYIGRGRGVAIKSFPDLDVSYYRKVTELQPDYVFILDKPSVSKEFISRIKKDNLPIIWIDHHKVEKPEDNYINYYNPVFEDGKYEPVSYIAYKVANKKQDLWLALIGCVSDCYLPDFYNEFQKEYPELSKKNPKGPFDVLYNSEIGYISRILDFSLKDTTTNVVKMLKYMMKVKGPMDVLEENMNTRQILKRYEEINSKYQVLMQKAREQAGKKIIYFQYGGSLSLSANLANQLSYEFPEKINIVVYIKGDIANISLRGPGDIRKLTLEAIKGIEGATGGGHKGATGAKMNVSELPVFKDRIEKLVKK